MISKTTLIALLAVFVVVFSSNCDKCQKMVGNCRTQFNNDFTNVSADQLKSCMDTQCDKEFSGFEKSACKSAMDKDKNELLKAFQGGETNQQICKQAGLC
ncbi:unnamed protein product, partial [Mesorhabditis belari]|uniref:Saposin B-type domain-containing protein n=1 Tax=Mesorhabditis belari TaxID=2138241 RepID=A0AAF3ECN9_9BILA